MGSKERTMPTIDWIKKNTGNMNVIFMQLDLSSLTSVKEFVETFVKNEERLDILINNAGMIAGDEVELNEDGIEKTLAVNYLGHHYLTNLLMDLLIQSGPGSRVVSVSSMFLFGANQNAFKNLDQLKRDGTKDLSVPGIFEMQKFPSWDFPSFLIQPILDLIALPPFTRYANSKFAQVLFTKELARRFTSKGVSSYVLHPGVIKTEIGSPRKQNDKVVSLNVASFFDAFPRWLNPQYLFWKNIEEGSQTTICCAVSDEFADQSGEYYTDVKPEN